MAGVGNVVCDVLQGALLCDCCLGEEAQGSKHSQTCIPDLSVHHITHLNGQGSKHGQTCNPDLLVPYSTLLSRPGRPSLVFPWVLG